jgi:WD40 repeat protein
VASEIAPELVALAWSPDSRLLASGHKSGSVTIWDTITGTIVASGDGFCEKALSAVAWHPRSNLITAGAEGVVWAWSAVPR